MTTPKKTSRAPKPNSEAELSAMIDHLAALWREFRRLCEMEGSLMRAAGARELDEHRARMDLVCDDAAKLERSIAYTEVNSPNGYAAKIQVINRAAFEDENLVMIAFQLGREAERLGITEPPRLEIGPTHDRPSCWTGAAAAR